MRSLIVHGGAWRIPDAKAEAHLAALRAALEKGRALVDAGASALEVVIEMVSLLEDDTTFRECRDPAPESGVELAMDAAVMDGASRRIGCCLRVRGVAHPVRLARAILEDGRAAVLAGPGASRFAGSVGIPARRPGKLRAPLRAAGAVCCDEAGRLAAATSTGLAPGPPPGRIGGAPIPGAGTWAEDGIGAASGAGRGEMLLREQLAFRAVHAIDTITVSWRHPARERDARRPHDTERITWGPVPTGLGRTPEAWAAREAILGLARGIGGTAGLILLGPDGSPGYAFNTPRMARGFWMEGMGGATVEIEPA